MTSHRFFRIVWRINAITLLVAAAGAVVILGIGAVALGGDMIRNWRAGDVVNVAGQEVESSRFQFEGFERLTGASVLRAPLVAYEPYRYSSSGGGREIHNYLYYDVGTSAVHWLLQKNDSLISWTCDLRPTTTPPEVGRVLGSLYAVVDSDSDHDGRLTSSDLSSVLLTDPSGGREARILERVTGLQGCEVLPPASAVLFYVSKAELRAATLDLEQIRLAGDVSLAALPARSQGP